MRKILWLMMLLSGLCWAHPRAEHLVIGSWNIENLGGERQQKPVALAELLRMTGVDLLSIQEFHVTHLEAGQRRNRIFDQVIELLNVDPKNDWTYEILPNREDPDRQRLCGVAWNRARVRKVGPAFKIPVQQPAGERKIWHRQPHGVKFSAGEGKTDLVLVPIHMKSNRSMPGKGPRFGREQRGAEARSLVDQLPALVAHFQGEKDLVLAGDTNCLDTGEKALIAFRGAGFRDLNVSGATTHVRRGTAFDRILVPHDQPEFKFSSQYVLTPTSFITYHEDLSDHLLVLTTLKIVEDDD